MTQTNHSRQKVTQLLKINTSPHKNRNQNQYHHHFHNENLESRPGVHVHGFLLSGLTLSLSRLPEGGMGRILARGTSLGRWFHSVEEWGDTERGFSSFREVSCSLEHRRRDSVHQRSAEVARAFPSARGPPRRRNLSPRIGQSPLAGEPPTARATRQKNGPSEENKRHPD